MWIVFLIISLTIAIASSFAIKQKLKHNSHLLYFISFIIAMTVSYVSLSKIYAWFSQTKAGLSLNDIIDKMPSDTEMKLGDILKDSQYSSIMKSINATSASSQQPSSAANPGSLQSGDADDGILY